MYIGCSRIVVLYEVTCKPWCWLSVSPAHVNTKKIIYITDLPLCTLFGIERAT